MKTKTLFLPLFILGLLFTNGANAEKEIRDVPSFSEISLRISGKLYIKQGSRQEVEIVAKSSTLDEIITEVRGRTLNIRTKTRNIFSGSFNPGKVEIYVTVPDIHALNVSGSGDIIASGKISSRIIDLTISGSGNIVIDKLISERVKASVSGSGDIVIGEGVTDGDLTVGISGSGNVKAGKYEARNVDVRIAGSGNATVYSNGNLKARVAGSGNVYYWGNPSIDTSVLGSGRVVKR